MYFFMDPPYHKRKKGSLVDVLDGKRNDVRPTKPRESNSRKWHMATRQVRMPVYITAFMLTSCMIEGIQIRSILRTFVD